MQSELKAAHGALREFQDTPTAQADESVLLGLAIKVQDATEIYVASHVS